MKNGEVIVLFKCSICGKPATWRAVDEVVALDTPYLCSEHIKTESVTERPEDNPCFQRIVEVNRMEEVIV